eukprot:8462930-Alexandrium_andersonii.AAC.1
MQSAGPRAGTASCSPLGRPARTLTARPRAPRRSPGVCARWAAPGQETARTRCLGASRTRPS